MSVQTAINGARIFDGDTWHEGKALLLENGKVVDIRPQGTSPAGIETVAADGRLVAPGFIDLQVISVGSSAVVPNFACAAQIWRIASTSC